MINNKLHIFKACNLIFCTYEASFCQDKQYIHHLQKFSIPYLNFCFLMSPVPVLSSGKTNLAVYRGLHFLEFYRSEIIPYLLCLDFITQNNYVDILSMLQCVSMVYAILLPNNIPLHGSSMIFLCTGFNGNEASSPRCSRCSSCELITIC